MFNIKMRNTAYEYCYIHLCLLNNKMSANMSWQNTYISIVLDVKKEFVKQSCFISR